MATEKKVPEWAHLTTRIELEIFAQKKGYKNPAFWAGKILDARAKKRRVS